MTIVSYVQMTHPARAIGAARVREQLRRPCDVVIDETDQGPWLTARRAWLTTPADCRWRCLLQDDIDLAPDFAPMLEEILGFHGKHVGGRPLALYNGLTDPTSGRDMPKPGEQWIERRDGVQGPAIVLHRADVAPMLDWCHRNVRVTPDMYSADIRPSLWLEAAGRLSLCPVPSWVQHRGGEPSLIGTKSTGSQPRTAPTFQGSPLSLGYDWRRGLLPELTHADGPARHGREHGASSRVRWKLWRTTQQRPDHELEHAGIDPRATVDNPHGLAAVYTSGGQS